ncbi:MAG: Cthe_2314 family HEPN domain-containing protein [Oceanospirillaceae bacterium]
MGPKNRRFALVFRSLLAALYTLRSIAIHTGNKHIKQLLSLVMKSLLASLTACQNGENTYKVSEIELYAQNIFSRASEIDNVFKNMTIALEYLYEKGYNESKYDFSEHHAFHVENFLLRLTSLVDRCYLLAGTTMLMENHKIECLGGNKKIYKQLAEFSPPSASLLKDMEGTIENLRETRNKVAHQSGFSSKNLGVLRAIENANKESVSVKHITDLLSHEEIKDIVIEDAFEPFNEVLTKMNELVEQLIDSLSFVYTGLLERI